MGTLVGSRMSYAQFRDLPDDGVLYEVLDGVVAVRASPTGEHQDIVGEVYARLREEVRRGVLGVVRLGPYDVVLDQHNATMPDLIFVQRQRAGILTSIGCFGAPDLIVEALSPTSIERDLKDKRATYERFGVTAYWVIDPAGEQLLCFDLVAGRYAERPALGREDTLTSPLFPELAIPLGEVFAVSRVARDLANTPQAPDVDLERVRFLEQWHRQRQRPTRRDDDRH